MNIELETKLNEVNVDSQGARSKLSEQISDLFEKQNSLGDVQKTQNSEIQEQCSIKMKDLFPVPTKDDFIKEFEKDEILANKDVNDIPNQDDSSVDEDGIITKEKEWFKNTKDR